MNDHPQTHDDGLSPAARTALAALRAEDDLAAEVRARMWSRLAAAAEDDVLPDMSQQSAPHVRGRPAPHVHSRPAPHVQGRPAPHVQGRRGPLLLGLAVAAGLTIALLGLQRGAQPVAVAPRADAAAYGGPGAAQRSTRAANGAAAAPAADAAIAGASGVPVPGDSSASAVPDGEPRSAPKRKPSDRAAIPEDMPAASASALAAEAALLQRVQTALATGAPAAALLQLEQHAREFPAGVLVQEREALRVVALCAAGREPEGRAEAATFLRAHAGSVLAERVRGACDEG